MNKKWFYIAISCVAVSVLSLFTSIITYTSVEGVKYRYSIIDLLKGDAFVKTVLTQYKGTIIWNMNGITVTCLAFAAVLAIFCAVTGLITLRAQRPNRWQFILTFIGLLGTTFPSLLIIIGVFLSDKFYNGTIRCGISPIITPIAMAICIKVVMRRRDKIREQMREEIEAQGLIWKAGDL